MYKLENNSVLCVSNIRDEQHATEKKSFLKWQNVLQMRQNWTTFEGYAVSRNGGRRTKVFPKFVKNFRNEVFSRLVLFLFKVTFAYFGSSIKFLPFTFLFLSLSSIQCAHFRLSKPTLYHGFPSTSWSTLTTYLPLHECFLSLSLSLSLSPSLSLCHRRAHFLLQQKAHRRSSSADVCRCHDPEREIGQNFFAMKKEIQMMMTTTRIIQRRLLRKVDSETLCTEMVSAIPLDR